MQVKITVDPAVAETTITIVTARLTQELLDLQNLIENQTSNQADRIVLTKGTATFLVPKVKIIRFFTENKRVYAETLEHGVCLVNLRLKDLEQQLVDNDFIRINQGEIVNLKYVEQLDFSLAGTIGLLLSNGHRSYVARRSMKAFRTALNMS